MRLVVCAMADLAALATRCRPAAAVSLLAPDQPEPPVPGDPPRLVLRFNDIVAPTDGLASPTSDHVARLLAFAAGLGRDATLLVHCWMGISRSPAAAFVLACAMDPARPEDDIAKALRDRAPSATPNMLLVRLADTQLGRDGRMIAAIARIGRGRDAALGAPFDLET